MVEISFFVNWGDMHMSSLPYTNQVMIHWPVIVEPTKTMVIMCMSSYIYEEAA